MTDAAIIYRTHVEAIETLPEAEQLKAYKALVAYCMDDEEPDDMIGRFAVAMAKPLLDKWKAKREAGAKGGSSAKQAEADRKQTEANESNAEANASKPKQTEANESNAEAKEKVKDIKEKDTLKSVQKESRHKYGEFKHVILTDKQYTALVDDYGEQTLADAIKRVDEYCEESGKRYSNYAIVIRRWGVRSTQQTARSGTSPAGKFGNFPQRQDEENRANTEALIAMYRP